MFLSTFFTAFAISFIGSIPPGTINVTIMQLSISHQQRAAIFLAIAATSVEFAYAGMTVEFHLFLSANRQISSSLQLITALALIVLGLFNVLRPSTSKANKKVAKGRSGFAKGILLGVFNPMTIPFWLVMTNYLENQRLISLEGAAYWAYLVGLSTGTFVLLTCIMLLGNRFTPLAGNRLVVKTVPGLILLSMGCYYLIKLLL